jgi:hypothetical protein
MGKFILVLSLFEVDIVVDTGLSDNGCLFNLSEMQLILEEVFDHEDFEMFCETNV